MTAYDWRKHWQPKTRGGYEVVDVRPDPDCTESGLIVRVNNQKAKLSHWTYNRGGWFVASDLKHSMDLLPVEQPHYDDEKSDPTLVDTVNTIATLTAERDRLRDALTRIEKWFGEFPPTGRFWTDKETDPMSYGEAYGSNGERDFMRQVAREALAETAKSEATA